MAFAIRSARFSSLTRSLPPPAARSVGNIACRNGLRSPFTLSLERYRPTTLKLTTYQPLSTSVKHLDGPPGRKRWRTQEEINQAKLVPHPEEVSETSSVHSVLHEKGVPDPEPDVDMLAGIKSDLRAIKETFALQEVPREAFVIGLAGVLPYLATSVSTLYLAWDINHASLTGEGFLVSGPTAEALLHVIEPLQIGYGAVILSFLGAIHWGLEWAKYGGVVGYRRYAYGVVAPAVAWPTTLFPVEYALITQFLAFTFFYFADAKAVKRGWAPSWYSTYRFVLTFIVGASIVVSLVGRGQIADKINRLPSPADRVRALKDIQFEAAEEEERYMKQRKVQEEEEEEEEEEDREAEGEDKEGEEEEEE